jgi:hypothetical protein
MCDPHITIINLKATANPNYATITFPGTLMMMTAHNAMMGYSVMVQGQVGTTITTPDNPFYP